MIDTQQPIRFKQLRETLMNVKAQVTFLLGMKDYTFTDQDYALYMVMKDMKTENPTRELLTIHVVAWLRFYGRLILSLPVGDTLRTSCLGSFYVLAMPYKALLKDIFEHESH